MLSPKRIKYRKKQRGKTDGIATRETPWRLVNMD